MLLYCYCVLAEYVCEGTLFWYGIKCCRSVWIALPRGDTRHDHDHHDHDHLRRRHDCGNIHVMSTSTSTNKDSSTANIDQEGGMSFGLHTAGSIEVVTWLHTYIGSTEVGRWRWVGGVAKATVKLGTG